MPKILFLDTNVLLHYQSFDQINWLKITGADAVKLIITPVNLRELNTIKDSPAHSWFRKRAKGILTKISRIINDGLSAILGENVELLIEHRDSTIDYGAYHLNQGIQDDNLIASILMYRQEVPDANIALVTSDDGITLLAKARPQGIQTIRIPEEFRLPDEPDPDREKVKELEQRIRELTAAMPSLSLIFEDGDTRITFTLPKPLAVPDDSEKEQRLNEIRQKYPKKQNEASQKSSKALTNLETKSKVYQDMVAAASYNIKRYDDELDKFYMEYSEYTFHDAVYKNRKGRTIILPIWILNDGTTPAEDIDIHLHFPDGFEIFEEEDLSEPPIEPKPPELKTYAESISEQWQTRVPLNGLFPPTHISSENFSYPNVSPPTIKRTNSYDVDINVGKVKHNYQVRLDKLYLVFDSFESAKSFHVDYIIGAANVPATTSGQLHVIIEKVS